MKRQLEMSILRFHVLDIAAWLSLPDWDNNCQKQARASLRELCRILSINPYDIDLRLDQLGIRKEDR